jgi:hypothetical protein
MIVTIFFEDLEWDLVDKVIEICEDTNSLTVQYVSGEVVRVIIYEVLFKSILNHGIKKAEKQFIEQDLNRDDLEHGLY